MFKFFRKIRYDLVESGKTGKYLKYAIGEILLVMVGILLAFQVNSWNQNRIDSNEENEYLNRLRTDIQRDFAEITRLNDKLTDRRQNIKRFMRYFGKQEMPQDSFNIQYWSTHHADDFLAHDDTYVDMLNTGKLDLISNDSVKLKILELYSQYDEIDQFEAHMQADSRDFQYNLSITLFDWETIINSQDQEAFLTEFNKVSSSLQTKNYFTLMNSISGGMTEQYEDGLNRIIELDSLLIKELE